MKLKFKTGNTHLTGPFRSNEARKGPIRFYSQINVQTGEVVGYVCSHSPAGKDLVEIPHLLEYSERAFGKLKVGEEREYCFNLVLRRLC